MFENNYSHNLKVHYSRYIASWINAHGGRYKRELFEGFRHWLRDECKLTDDEIHDIWEMATNGKLELQENARRYLKNYKEQ